MKTKKPKRQNKWRKRAAVSRRAGRGIVALPRKRQTVALESATGRTGKI